MPTYTFVCRAPKCGEIVESFQHISAYKPLEKCPKCKKKTLQRDLQSDLPTGKVVKGDSEITVGELAARNSKRFSKDYKEHLHNERFKYRETPPAFTESKAAKKRRLLQEFASGMQAQAAQKGTKKNVRKSKPK